MSDGIVTFNIPQRKLATSTYRRFLDSQTNVFGTHPFSSNIFGTSLVFQLLQEIAKCVSLANADDRVHVIVLCGNGRAFCAGYDLKEYSEGSAVGHWP